MKAIHGSPLLRLLRCKRLLRERLQWLGLHDEETAQWLVDLDNKNGTSEVTAPSTAVCETLTQHALIYCDDTIPIGSVAFKDHRKPSLAFVHAVNFELTYECNWDCGHCLQQGIRKRRSGLWLPTEVGTQTLTDAWFAGLVSTGVNFTGGELFLPQSNLPELVEAARALKIDVRINTNGWWGDKKNIQLGRMKFQSAGHVIGWLRETGVATLALSFDNRYKDRPEAWLPVASIIRECERHGQRYQVVCTGAGLTEAHSQCDHVMKNAGVSPRNLVPMDMIDIGGASGKNDKPLETASLSKAIYRSPCKGKGFFRPRVLQIAPDGGVRTCMYAPGGGWMGNLNRESLLDIANRFADSPVTTRFSNGEVASFVDASIRPYAHIYRSVNHPCAVSAVLARVIEAAASADTSPCGIHESIAAEMNVGSKVLGCKSLNEQSGMG